MADKTEEKKGVNTVIASLAGAAVGAAVGAGAIILSDKKNQKRLQAALDGLKKQGFDVLEIVSREAQTVKSKLETNGKKAVKTAKKPKAKTKAKK